MTKAGLRPKPAVFSGFVTARLLHRSRQRRCRSARRAAVWLRLPDGEAWVAVQRVRRSAAAMLGGWEREFGARGRDRGCRLPVASGGWLVCVLSQFFVCGAYSARDRVGWSALARSCAVAPQMCRPYWWASRLPRGSILSTRCRSPATYGLSRCWSAMLASRYRASRALSVLRDRVNAAACGPGGAPSASRRRIVLSMMR